jgi:chromosome segregation ATPase
MPQSAQSPDLSIQIIEALRAVNGHVSSTKEELAAIRGSMSQMAEAITRLAVLEEKHQGIAADMRRAEEKIEGLDDAITQMKLENASLRGQAQGASVVVKAMWTVAGTGVIAIAAALMKIAFGSGLVG